MIILIAMMSGTNPVRLWEGFVGGNCLVDCSKITIYLGLFTKSFHLHLAVCVPRYMPFSALVSSDGGCDKIIGFREHNCQMW